MAKTTPHLLSAVSMLAGCVRADVPRSSLLGVCAVGPEQTQSTQNDNWRGEQCTDEGATGLCSDGGPRHSAARMRGG